MRALNSESLGLSEIYLVDANFAAVSTIAKVTDTPIVSLTQPSFSHGTTADRKPNPSGLALILRIRLRISCSTKRLRV